MSRLHDKYPPGKKFRVVREGGSLHGYRPGGPGWHQGWRRELPVGEVVETLGYGAGFGSDPGYGIHFKSPDGQAQFSPSQGSAFTFEPADGYLEPIGEEQEASSGVDNVLPATGTD